MSVYLYTLLIGAKILAPERGYPVLYTKYIGCCGSFDSQNLKAGIELIPQQVCLR